MESPLQIAATRSPASVPARPPDPCLLVLFGATGDLAHRKIVPALYALARGGELPSPFGVVGTSTSVEDAATPTEPSCASRSSALATAGRSTTPAGAPFAAGIDTVAADYTKPEAFAALRAAIEAAEKRQPTARQPALLPGGAARRSSRRS